MVDYSITELDISSKGLTQLPDDIDKYTNLQELNCWANHLTSLDNLPPNLQELYCGNNRITSLDNIPLTLKELDCEYNPLIYDFELIIENIRKYNATRKLSSNT